MKSFVHKKFYLFAISFVFGVLLMASCSFSPGVENYIPDEAVGVACLNFESIAKKGELDNLKNMTIVKELRNELRYESSEIDDLVEQLMNDPKSSGLDLRKDIAAAVFEFRDDAMIEAVAKMLNKNDFENTLRKIFKGNMMRDADDFSYVEDEDFIIAWNKKVALVLVTGEEADMFNEAKKILALSKENSIASNANFTKFKSNSCDVGLYVDLGNLTRVPEIRRELSEIPQSFMNGIDNAAIFGNLNFEKGEAVLRCQAVNVENQYYQKVFEQKFNANLLNYMPTKALAAATLSVNMQALIDMIKSLDGNVLKEEFGRDYTVGDVINCFNGSAAAAISDLNQDKWGPIPVFTITADLSNASKLKQIMNSIAEKENGYYLIDDDLYMDIKNDVVVISNELSNMNARGNGLRDIASDAKSGFFAYADLNINNYPAWLKSNLNNESKNFMQSLCTSAMLRKVDDNAVEVRLSIPSGNQNCLAYTLQLFDSYLYKLDDIAGNIEDAIYPPIEYDDYLSEYSY